MSSRSPPRGPGHQARSVSYAGPVRDSPPGPGLRFPAQVRELTECRVGPFRKPSACCSNRQVSDAAGLGVPVAGILLGSARRVLVDPRSSQLMMAASGTIFANLPLIFAIGVAWARPTTTGSRPGLSGGATSYGARWGDGDPPDSSS